MPRIRDPLQWTGSSIILSVSNYCRENRQGKLQPSTMTCTLTWPRTIRSWKEAPHIIKRRPQMGEYKCEMPQFMVLYTNLSIKNMTAASFLPSKFIQILFVANMNLEPYSTGNYETFSSWLRWHNNKPLQLCYVKSF